MSLRFLALALVFLYSSAFPTCISDSARSIDTWFLIKGPKGTSYMYSDANSTLLPSNRNLNSTIDGALARTVSQLWNTSNEYLLFNDEPVTITDTLTTSLISGHTKGIWIWNVANGKAIILTHSVPLYPVGPSRASNYKGLGGNAYTYAQHMACFSTSLDALNRLAVLAALTAPTIYDTRISVNTPIALRALATGRIATEAACNTTSFQTTGGRNVTYFAKSLQWNNELYASCIAPTLKSALVTETWIRGSEEGPYCGTYPVLDATYLNFTYGLAWKETQDHSKWAVGLGSTWVCPSDINRMLSQYGRGGSSYCFQNTALSTVMLQAVTASDVC